MPSKPRPQDLRAIPARAQSRSSGQLRLRVSAAAESIIRSGHPWLFAESIRSQSRAGGLGDLAVVYDRNDTFLALGLYDPHSPIRVRILHKGKPRRVDEHFWEERLEAAVSRRQGLFDSQTTGFRWINGESDGWPGLVLDRYDQTLVLKLYTASWFPWLDRIRVLIHDKFKPERIVLRLSRNISKNTKAPVESVDGQVISGSPLERPLTFLETGLGFEADVVRGQKTGFFLDQRENRRKVETLAAGKVVLNAFSFSSGFSVYAARGQARSVLDLDISSHALVAGERNFELNKSHPAVRACKREAVQGDAFEWLAASHKRKFDLVILDPPSLAKRESERAGAIQAYGKLASMGIVQLCPGGVLLACSCSAHVSDEQFYSAVRSAAASSRREFIEIECSGQPSDHPATFPEARYLKAIYLRF